MEDGQIIELYWQRDPSAITASEQKYGAYCLSVARNILHDTQDCEECVNDTWFRAWNAMPPQRPTKLRMFLARITRNLAFNRFRARGTQKRGGEVILLVLDELAECLAGERDVAEEYEAKELSESIRRFVAALPEREGNLFIRRYFFAEPISQIAERYGLTEGNVMVILSRTRKKLKEHLREEGFLHGSE